MVLFSLKDLWLPVQPVQPGRSGNQYYSYSCSHRTSSGYFPLQITSSFRSSVYLGSFAFRVLFPFGYFVLWLLCPMEHFPFCIFLSFMALFHSRHFTFSGHFARPENFEIGLHFIDLCILEYFALLDIFPLGHFAHPGILPYEIS